MHSLSFWPAVLQSGVTGWTQFTVSLSLIDQQRSGYEIRLVIFTSVRRANFTNNNCEEAIWGLNC